MTKEFKSSDDFFYKDPSQPLSAYELTYGTGLIAKRLGSKLYDNVVQTATKEINDFRETDIKIITLGFGIFATFSLMDYYTKNSCWRNPNNIKCFYDVPDLKNILENNIEKAFHHIKDCPKNHENICDQFNKEIFEELYAKDSHRVYRVMYDCVSEDSKFCDKLAEDGFLTIVKSSIYKAQTIAEECLSKKTIFCDKIFSLGKEYFNPDFIAYLKQNCLADSGLSCLVIKA